MLSEINPRLVYGSATGYGLSGPNRDNLAMDLTVQAVSGIMSVTGFADGPPVKAGPAITDFISGVHLYAGIMTALYDRETSGRGRLVEIAMVETVYPAMASNLADVFNRKAAAPRTGNRHGGLAEAPYNVYPASDGYVAIISVNESHWTGLTRAMGRPELGDDPRFRTVLDRLKHIDLTDQVVSDWSSQLTRNEIVEACRANRVPCSAVRDLLEVTEDKHLHARGMLREIEHPEYGDILVHRSPLVLHDTERRNTSRRRVSASTMARSFRSILVCLPARSMPCASPAPLRRRDIRPAFSGKAKWSSCLKKLFSEASN